VINSLLLLAIIEDEFGCECATDVACCGGCSKFEEEDFGGAKKRKKFQRV